MRANGIAEFAFKNDVQSWTGKDGRRAELVLANFPEYANADDFGRSVFANGMKQKIADSAAGAEDKLGAMIETAQRLAQRIWNAERAGGVAQDIALFLEVLKRVYPARDAVKLAEYANSKTAVEARAMMAEVPAFKKMAEVIRLERVKKAGVDVAKLVAEIEAI